MQATAEPMRGEGLGAGLTDERAREIYRQGEEAVVFALLQQAKLLTEADHTGVAASNAISPSTPSGMKPVYTKPPASSRRKRPGRRNGHPGARRKVPNRIDRKLDHRLKRCPHCAGQLSRCHQARQRYTEDIPENLEPIVTEHTIHRDWCPTCKTHVEPVVSDALPGAMLGNQIGRAHV